MMPMTRFRVGSQMRSILDALNRLENPKHGYKESSHGITQTEIIFRVLDIKPYTEIRKHGHDMWIKKKDETDALLKELDETGKTVETRESGDHLIIDAYTGTYDYEPEQLRLASALMGKKVGLSASPYNFMGRVQAAMLVAKNPEMKNDPNIKIHFDWAEATWKGRNKANKIYASFSRSLKKLLDHGFIKSEHRRGEDQVRWFRTRYLITENGRDYLSKG